MITILSLFIVCAVLAFLIETAKTDQNRNTFIFICLTILTFVSGTRLVGGMDFPTYEGLYYNTPTFPEVLNPELRNNRYEIGYIYISSHKDTSHRTPES